MAEMTGIVDEIFSMTAAVTDAIETLTSVAGPAAGSAMMAMIQIGNVSVRSERRSRV